MLDHGHTPDIVGSAQDSLHDDGHDNRPSRHWSINCTLCTGALILVASVSAGLGITWLIDGQLYDAAKAHRTTTKTTTRISDFYVTLIRLLLDRCRCAAQTAQVTAIGSLTIPLTTSASRGPSLPGPADLSLPVCSLHYAESHRHCTAL